MKKILWKLISTKHGLGVAFVAAPNRRQAIQILRWELHGLKGLFKLKNTKSGSVKYVTLFPANKKRSVKNEGTNL